MAEDLGELAIRRGQKAGDRRIRSCEEVLKFLRRAAWTTESSPDRAAAVSLDGWIEHLISLRQVHNEREFYGRLKFIFFYVHFSSESGHETSTVRSTEATLVRSCGASSSHF